MKKKNLFLFLACGLILASCGGTGEASSNSSPVSDTTSQGDQSQPIGGDSVISSDQSSAQQGGEDVDYYAIRVTAPAGVEYTLDKTKAAAGEDVTLTLKANNGVLIDTVTLNKSTILKGNNGVYKFTMPDRSASIVITVTISGDIVINGEFNAVLTDDDHDGVFVAKDVKVTSSTTMLGFSYQIKGADGTMTAIDSMKLDRDRTFANVTFSNNSNYELSIGTNASYDFYYDTNEPEYPCYIIRTGVDHLPDSKDTLFNLFDGWSSFLPTCNPPDLNGISYKYTSNSLSYDYNYKLYENNVSYAKVNDITNPDAPETYHVYKAVDVTAGTYTLVNTYTKAKGNNENTDWVWKIDANRSEEKYYQPVAAKMDLTEGETAIRSRVINKREALHNVEVGAHYGAQLEYEFYEAYRGDYNQTATINASSWGDLKINSTRTTDGFQTKVVSALEYNREGSGSTADVTQHDAYMYNLTIDFLANGAVKKLDFTTTYYAKSDWNFISHAPINGAQGTSTKIELENSFGAPSKETVPFDTTPYFINKISFLNFYDDKTKKDPSNTTSYLSYGDSLDIVPLYHGGEKSPLVRTFTYSPTTALDCWQYTVSDVSNEEVVGLNAQGEYIVTGMGTTNVTFTNGTKNSAIVSKTISLETVAGGTVNGFFQNGLIPGYDSYQSEHSEKLIGQAGQVCTYWIDGANNTGCPVEYSILFRGKDKFGGFTYSPESEYCKVLTTGNVLTLDFNTEASKALTSAKELTIVFDSEFYKEGFSATVMTVTINPAVGTLAGTTWKAPYTDGKSYAQIAFGTEVTTNGAKKGTITEVLYNNEGAIEEKNVWGFTYSQSSNGKIRTTIVSANVQAEGFDNIASNYHLVIEGLSEDGLLKVAMYYENAQADEYASIFGDVEWLDDYGYDINSYWGFGKVN
ncbi:MAG: hypothetical protein MJ238_02590 [Bacilli bacterium]|nr:hypothetical protein [Bacilli bacterium]